MAGIGLIVAVRTAWVVMVTGRGGVRRGVFIGNAGKVTTVFTVPHLVDTVWSFESSVCFDRRKSKSPLST